MRSDLVLDAESDGSTTMPLPSLRPSTRWADGDEGSMAARPTPCVPCKARLSNCVCKKMEGLFAVKLSTMQGLHYIKPC
jgi:hypothetical protein